MQIRIVAGCVLLLFASAPLQAAGLVWATTTLQADAAPGARVVTFDFPFRNDGVGAVTLVSVDTSCRCLSVDLARATYAPGEKGDLRVAFSVGNQTGLLEKSVTVTTDEDRAIPVRLVLRLTVADKRP